MEILPESFNYFPRTHKVNRHLDIYQEFFNERSIVLIICILYSVMLHS